MSIKAIRKSIEEPRTGAVAVIHYIEHYTVDLRSNVCSATVNGYVSEDVRAAGKQPLTAQQVTVQGQPPVGSDTVQWLYEQMSAAATVIRDPMGNPIPSAGGNAFAGGELVLDDVTDVQAK